MHARAPRMIGTRAVLLAALIMLLLTIVAGAVRGAPSSSAAPAGTGTATCATARQWYVDANGRPQLLPWCGEAAGEASAAYPGRWLRGPKLDIAGAVTTTPTPSPSVSASPSPTPTSSTTSSSSATGELAPVLSLDGVPAVVGTVGSVDVRWTPAKAPGGGSVAFYVVQQRASNDTAWRQSSPSTTATHATVTGLSRSTDYLFRVQAVYADGTRGEWSNSLAVSVPA